MLCSHSEQDIERRDKCNRTIHDVATDDCKDLLENLREWLQCLCAISMSFSFDFLNTFSFLSSRLVPGSGSSPVLRRRRSRGHVSCGGDGGGGGEVEHQQPARAGQSLGRPCHALGSAGLRAHPRLRLPPPDPLSDSQGGGAARPSGPRPHQYCLLPYR